MFHLSTLPSLREGGRWLVLIYVPRYVPAIVAATDFGYIWEHLKTYALLATVAEKYVAFVLPEAKSKN